MIIRTLQIDKEEFLEALTYLNRHNEEKLESSMPLISKLLESSSDSRQLLKELDCIEDNSIQCTCRRAVIAQMYDTKVEYQYHGGKHSRNYITYCRNKIAVIRTQPQGCVIISKYGDVLVDEGKVWLNGNGFYGPYCVIRQIIDDQEGVISNAGEFVFPFGLFDGIHLSLSLNTALYKGQEFSFNIWGNISEVSSDDLKDFMESSN